LVSSIHENRAKTKKKKHKSKLFLNSFMVVL